MSRSNRTLALALAATAAVLAGCSMDDVELNGGIFNAIGVGQTQKAVEPQLAARAPIVVPPTLERLPAPGSAPEADATDMTASINDPDRAAVVNKADLERQQAEYCEKHYRMAKALGDNNADQATGPLGPCRASILTSIKQWNEGAPAE